MESCNAAQEERCSILVGLFYQGVQSHFNPSVKVLVTQHRKSDDFQHREVRGRNATFCMSCSSVVRSFRFAATLTAQQVVTSLIRAMLSLGEARETAQRQMAAEEKKKASKVCQSKQSHLEPHLVSSGASGH